MSRPYVVLNINTGNGPYLRGVEQILEINRSLGVQGDKAFGVIIPWLYGERQVRILREEFSTAIDADLEFILLDEAYGAHMGALLYDGSSYNEYLRAFAEHQPNVQQAVRQHFTQPVNAHTLNGTAVTITPEQLRVEYARNPTIVLGLPLSVYTSICQFSRVLKTALTENIEWLDRDAANAALPLIEGVESAFSHKFIAHPATFSYSKEVLDEIKKSCTLCPPLGYPPARTNETMEPGVFVTVSGIPNLPDREFAGIKLYASNPNKVPGSERRTPGVLYDPNVRAHIARSGWGSVWASLFTGAPLIVTPYEQDDDLEIYYNNRTIEATGLGVVWDSKRTPEENVGAACEVAKGYSEILAEIKNEFGTDDGFAYVAEKLYEELLRAAGHHS